jgi:hypothetical protein
MTRRDQEIVNAVINDNVKLFKGSFTGTQLTLGVLLRVVALDLVETQRAHESSAVDAIGLIGRSCQILDTAFDETHDRQLQSLFRKEIVNSLEQAMVIKEKLSYRDFSGTSHPLRWVYIFVLQMLEAFPTIPASTREAYRSAALLLLDYLVSETDELGESDTLTPDQEDVKQDQVANLQSLREKIVNLH